MFTIENEGAEHAAEIDHLMDLAFGPGRFAKTAYRLREGVAQIPALSFVAWMDAEGGRRFIGSLRFWPVWIGPVAGLMLGPLAVDPTDRGKGGGLALMREGLEAARKLGYELVILVGDPAYYAKVGFQPVPPGRLTMPGPVDPARLLYRELVPGAFEGVSGPIRKFLPSD